MFLTQKYNFIHAVLLKIIYIIKELEENAIESTISNSQKEVFML